MKKFKMMLAAIAAVGLLVTNAMVSSDAAPVRVRPSPYDGLWSVSIFTQYGPCDASYRYPARIIAGQVFQAEDDFSYQLTGVVTRNGGIAVTVSRGGQSATGYGRLIRNTGSGWWRTDGGQCSGVWNAIKRVSASPGTPGVLNPANRSFAQ